MDHISISQKSQYKVEPPFAAWHGKQRRIMLLMSRPVVTWGILLECISELVDVLWLVRPSRDTFPEDVPQMFDWRQVWGLRWPWENRDSVELKVTLDNTCMMGSRLAVLKMNALPCRQAQGTIIGSMILSL